MKRSRPAFLFVAMALLYWGCSENGPLVSEFIQGEQVTESLGKKPAPYLSGTMNVNFVGGVVTWDGVVDLDGYGQYGMRFYNISGPPRDYSQANPYEEIWEVYDLGNPTLVYLGGTDAGVVSLANSSFRMNGGVEVATGVFEAWLGRNTHMSGTITWQTLPNGMVIPATAVGPFRVN